MNIWMGMMIPVKNMDGQYELGQKDGWTLWVRSIVQHISYSIVQLHISPFAIEKSDARSNS
jgi:hypothetical protein